MAAHIQPAGVADAGIAGETAGPRRSAAAASSAPASRSCCSTLFAVVMLFPVLWMLETALKETKDIYAVPAKVFSFDADARPLQGRLQLGLAGASRASRTR